MTTGCYHFRNGEWEWVRISPYQRKASWWLVGKEPWYLLCGKHWWSQTGPPLTPPSHRRAALPMTVLQINSLTVVGKTVYPSLLQLTHTHTYTYGSSPHPSLEHTMYSFPMTTTHTQYLPSPLLPIHTHTHTHKPSLTPPSNRVWEVKGEGRGGEGRGGEGRGGEGRGGEGRGGEGRGEEGRGGEEGLI